MKVHNYTLVGAGRGEYSCQKKNAQAGGDVFAHYSSAGVTVGMPSRLPVPTYLGTVGMYLPHHVGIPTTNCTFCCIFPGRQVHAWAGEVHWPFFAKKQRCKNKQQNSCTQDARCGLAPWINWWWATCSR